MMKRNPPFFVIYLFLIFIGNSFSFFPSRYGIHRWKLYSLNNFHDFLDISLDKDGGLLKKVERIGNPGLKGSPQLHDVVLVDWVFKHLNGSVIDESSSLPFDRKLKFMVGNDYQVIKGLDIGVRTMYEGESASFFVTPEYGWGSQGFMPYFAPNETFLMDITLLQVIIGLRQYETVSPDYDYRAELERKIGSGEISVEDLSPSSTELDTEPPGETDVIHSDHSSIEKGAMNSSSILSENSNDSPLKSVNQREIVDEAGRPVPMRTPKFYNPSKHKLDPNRFIQGIGNGHSWEETASTITLEVPISNNIEKKDLDVIIR